eukprot:g3454.t1
MLLYLLVLFTTFFVAANSKNFVPLNFTIQECTQTACKRVDKRIALDSASNHSSGTDELIIIDSGKEAMTLKYGGPQVGGPRVYLIEENGVNENTLFNLKGNEFSFDVQLSSMPCGFNAALYFVGMNVNRGAAEEGTDYCDAQAVAGTFCSELDLFEANLVAQQFTTHACVPDCASFNKNEQKCQGNGSPSTVCDQSGCGLNPFRYGPGTTYNIENNNEKWYGPGSHFNLDSSQKFTVVTQFNTNDEATEDEGSTLNSITRFYIQNGKRIDLPTLYVLPPTDGQHMRGFENPSITSDFCADIYDRWNGNGGYAPLSEMGNNLDNGMVLAMSAWYAQETYVNGKPQGSQTGMSWLDGMNNWGKYIKAGPKKTSRTVASWCCIISHMSNTAEGLDIINKVTDRELCECLVEKLPHIFTLPSNAIVVNKNESSLPPSSDANVILHLTRVVKERERSRRRSSVEMATEVAQNLTAFSVRQTERLRRRVRSRRQQQKEKTTSTTSASGEPTFRQQATSANFNFTTPTKTKPSSTSSQNSTGTMKKGSVAFKAQLLLITCRSEAWETFEKHFKKHGEVAPCFQINTNNELEKNIIPRKKKQNIKRRTNATTGLPEKKSMNKTNRDFQKQIQYFCLSSQRSLSGPVKISGISLRALSYLARQHKFYRLSPFTNCLQEHWNFWLQNNLLKMEQSSRADVEKRRGDGGNRKNIHSPLSLTTSSLLFCGLDLNTTLWCSLVSEHYLNEPNPVRDLATTGSNNTTTEGTNAGAIRTSNLNSTTRNHNVVGRKMNPTIPSRGTSIISDGRNKFQTEQRQPSSPPQSRVPYNKIFQLLRAYESEKKFIIDDKMNPPHNFEESSTNHGKEFLNKVNETLQCIGHMQRYKYPKTTNLLNELLIDDLQNGSSIKIEAENLQKYFGKLTLDNNTISDSQEIIPDSYQDELRLWKSIPLHPSMIHDTKHDHHFEERGNHNKEVQSEQEVPVVQQQKQSIKNNKKEGDSTMRIQLAVPMSIDVIDGRVAHDEMMNERSEIPNKRSEIPNKRSEAPNKRSEAPNKRSEVPNKRSEVLPIEVSQEKREQQRALLDRLAKAYNRLRIESAGKDELYTLLQNLNQYWNNYDDESIAVDEQRPQHLTSNFDTNNDRLRQLRDQIQYVRGHLLEQKHAQETFIHCTLRKWEENAGVEDSNNNGEKKSSLLQGEEATSSTTIRIADPFTKCRQMIRRSERACELASLRMRMTFASAQSLRHGIVRKVEQKNSRLGQTSDNILSLSKIIANILEETSLNSQALQDLRRLEAILLKGTTVHHPSSSTGSTAHPQRCSSSTTVDSNPTINLTFLSRKKIILSSTSLRGENKIDAFTLIHHLGHALLSNLLRLRFPDHALGKLKLVVGLDSLSKMKVLSDQLRRCEDQCEVYASQIYDFVTQIVLPQAYLYCCRSGELLSSNGSKNEVNNNSSSIISSSNRLKKSEAMAKRQRRALGSIGKFRHLISFIRVFSRPRFDMLRKLYIYLFTSQVYRSKRASPDDSATGSTSIYVNEIWNSLSNRVQSVIG